MMDRMRISRQLAVLGLVAVLSAGLAAACSPQARKEKKCRKVKEHIIGLAVDVEVRLGKLAPEKERLTGEEHSKVVEARVDPQGGFVAMCMETISDETLDCMLEARRLSDLESCRRSAGP
jgi:hypothetical protein